MKTKNGNTVHEVIENTIIEAMEGLSETENLIKVIADVSHSNFSADLYRISDKLNEHIKQIQETLNEFNKSVCDAKDRGEIKPIK
ncbi:MAG: hypothetical protein AABY22_05800 [Nanoarchaeota archaeon]